MEVAWPPSPRSPLRGPVEIHLPHGRQEGTPDSIPPLEEWSAEIHIVRRSPQGSYCNLCWRWRYVLWDAEVLDGHTHLGALCGPCMTETVQTFWFWPDEETWQVSVDDGFPSYTQLRPGEGLRCYWCWRWTRSVRTVDSNGLWMCTLCMTSLLLGGEPPWSPNHKERCKRLVGCLFDAPVDRGRSLPVVVCDLIANFLAEKWRP